MSAFTIGIGSPPLTIAYSEILLLAFSHQSGQSYATKRLFWIPNTHSVHKGFHIAHQEKWKNILSLNNKALATLMPLCHCHKPVFRPKMAVFRRVEMREGGRVATPTSFSIFDSYDMKSL